MPTTQERLDRLASHFKPTLEGEGAEPNLHLFHAAGSICSQKVRATLFSLGRQFYSYELNMLAGENYEPDYVRVRAEECRARGLAFAAVHDGGSSVADFGCDACVVPTVIDGQTHEVMVDSVSICMELAARHALWLCPPDLSDDIHREMAIVDRLQNYGLLAPKLAARSRAVTGRDFYQAKLAHCDRHIKAFSGDDLMVSAYSAKRAKESMAIEHLLTDEAVSAAHDRMAAAFKDLAGRLSGPSGFLLSETLTLADIFWATELIRAEDVGRGAWISDHPNLDAYYHRLLLTPVIRKAIVDWPGARFDFADHRS